MRSADLENALRSALGTRRLSPVEQELIAEIKHYETRLLACYGYVMDHLEFQETGGPDMRRHQHEAMARRWAQIGRTDIEKGVMALIRAVAQPQPRAE